MTKSAFLHLDQLIYRYPNSTAGIDIAHLAIPKGQFHCLLGRSGCGKSTLLKLIAGLLQPHQGGIYLGNQPQTQPRADVSVVFQQATLLNWLNVLDNVLLPARLQKRVDSQLRTKAMHLLAELKLESYAKHYPTQLSGGQQSRVAIARALLLKPTLLLMDEPFAALDALTREQLQDHLLETVSQHHTTVLFVTHDISEAIYLADSVTVLEHGRIAEQIAIPLPRPRVNRLRYEPDYLALCQQLHQFLVQP